MPFELVQLSPKRYFVNSIYLLGKQETLNDFSGCQTEYGLQSSAGTFLIEWNVSERSLVWKGHRAETGATLVRMR